MKLKNFAAAAICVAAGAFAAPAMADTISYDISAFGPSYTDLLTSLAVKQFDPSKGVLTGVSIAYSATVTGDVLLTNVKSTNKQVDIDLTSTMTLKLPDNSVVGTDTKSLFSGTVTSVKKTSDVLAGHNSVVLLASGDLSSSYFSMFTGTSDVTGMLSVTAVSSAVSPSGITADYTTSAIGEGHVTYTFNAAPVPEPETYGMLLLGMGVVAFAAKRKSRSAQA
ncbi:choice-of-anchor E domain-containing protein [Rugamonas sp. FT107W]|uniref:Choice-of-anchor E domain-containing protein n=1 Tax=Duganella vulcania TaxID=2692166 RepID=A0A845H8Q9_9BURK|nr:choice-of-anchor E domain-containing protein [Duganella vulcania]MYN15392.1 choice-of-anchor E domain-containing protein [Duganella vulcania]